jgi:hypothetical protein
VLHAGMPAHFTVGVVFVGAVFRMLCCGSHDRLPSLMSARHTNGSCSDPPHAAGARGSG